MTEIKNFFEKYKKYSIYGCGKEGQLLYSIFSDRAIPIVSYVVSDEIMLSDDFKELEIPIYGLSEWVEKNDKNEVGILVPQRTRFLSEIVRNLQQKSLDHYVVPLEEEQIQEIGLLDTRISDENHGNQIIMQAVEKYVSKIYERGFIYHFPYWDDFGVHTLNYMKRCKYLILGGTNALNSHMRKEKWMGVNSGNIDIIRNKCVLMGVGWRRYEEEPDEYTRVILTDFLNKDILHSVRDEQTKGMLENIGIENVLNTGCPSIWGLTPEHCKEIPSEKAENVCIMISGADENVINKVVQMARENYRKIFFWVQGPTDYYNTKRVCPEAIPIRADISDLDSFLLQSRDIEYIGTRLHCGIKFLQHKKRSFIIAIDNRAKEMKKSFHLPVFLPSEIDKLENLISKKVKTEIIIPEKDICRWLSQF